MRQNMHAVLNVRAYNSRGKLWAKRKLFTALRFERVHLFLYDIGTFSGGALIKRSSLNKRQVNAFKPVVFYDVFRFLENKSPIGLFRRQYVVHAFWSLQLLFFYLWHSGIITEKSRKSSPSKQGRET